MSEDTKTTLGVESFLRPTLELPDLDGPGGNVFNIIGLVSGAWKRLDMADKAKEFQSRAMSSGSYEEVLTLCDEYVIFK